MFFTRKIRNKQTINFCEYNCQLAEVQVDILLEYSIIQVV